MICQLQNINSLLTNTLKESMENCNGEEEEDNTHNEDIFISFNFNAVKILSNRYSVDSSKFVNIL